jgi:hypothetical protein
MEDTPSCDTIKPGLCQCRCGGRTSIAKANNKKWGWIAGEPVRYLRGHNRRKAVRYVAVDAGFVTNCWIWKLAKTNQGYGLCSGPSGKTTCAHRLYYEDKWGQIPPGRQIDHLCRIPSCVNPDHLEAVTAKENIHRGSGTKVTPSDVEEIRRSSDLQSQLARRYGVSQPQISRIKNGLSWR